MIGPLASVGRREQIVGVIMLVLGFAVATLGILAFVLRAPDDRTGNGPPVAVASQPRASSSGPTTPTPTPTPTAPPPATAAATATATATPTPGRTTAVAMPLVVLNNTTRSGLAQQAATTFSAGGWKVTSTGNLAGDIVSTCAYYDPSVAGAEAAATRLMGQFPAIQRVKVKFGGLPSGPIVVVLTRDYTST